MPREGIHEEEEDEEEDEDDEVLVNCSMDFGTAFCFVASLSMVQDSFIHSHRCVCVCVCVCACTIHARKRLRNPINISRFRSVKYDEGFFIAALHAYGYSRNYLTQVV